MLNSTRLLLDLQHVSDIAQRISGTLDADDIARQLTDGLVEKFDCAFARIWLVEPDQTHLRLVASSGLYTHINGSFARVPIGAYKVGKIAQNRVPFLSNHLAEESWVKDRQWAIANNIRGFAGYPLAVRDRVIGVLATFSHHAMDPEFLEVLQVLCMTATIALDSALRIQYQTPQTKPTSGITVLSDQISAMLTSTRLMLVGTEQTLTPSVVYTFLRTAEILAQLHCSYCRLTYHERDIALEAIATLHPLSRDGERHWVNAQLKEIQFMATYLGGSLVTELGDQGQILHLLLNMPYAMGQKGASVIVQCQRPVLQTALLQLAYLAGLDVCSTAQDAAIAITDYDSGCKSSTTQTQIIWVRHSPTAPVPHDVNAVIDLSIQPDQLRRLVDQLSAGEPIQDFQASNPVYALSDREQEIMALLAQGLRDRDIAQKLFISESTVKFHINNSLTKLNARNRYQAVYQAAILGWI